MRLVLLYYILSFALLAASQDVASGTKNGTANPLLKIGDLIKSAKGEEVNYLESFKIKTNSVDFYDETKICFPNPCNNSTALTVFPDPFDPTKFYICNADRVPIPHQCPEGSEFNVIYEICEKVSDIICNSHQCNGLPDNTKIPALTTNEGYCECVNGLASYHNCPDNGEFNFTTSQCDPPICDFKKCQFPKEIIPAANTNDGYCECFEGYKSCPAGEKFGKFGICFKPCVDQLCTGKPEAYAIASTVNDNSFCVCHTGMSATYKECESTNYIFDEKKQSCMLNSKKLCGTELCTDLGPKPAKNTLTGFCLCTKPGDKPVFKECLEGVYDDSKKICSKLPEDICDFTKCSFPSQRIAAANTTDGYCDCTTGYEPCPEGQKFGKYLMCMPPCSIALCTRNEYTYVVESTVNDHSFCICQTIATYEMCEPKGFIFDSNQGRCVPNSI